MKAFWTVWLILCATAVAGQGTDTPEGLRTAIKAAATNASEQAEHTVDINDCEMTTYVWKPWKDSGMKLWSSFKFDMRFTRWAAGSKENVVIAVDDRIAGTEQNGMVLIMFEMKAGRISRHEVPEFRKHGKSEHRISPRQAYVPFFYRDTTSFFIMHEGAGVVDKALTFTSLYERYVAEYCFTLS